MKMRRSGRGARYNVGILFYWVIRTKVRVNVECCRCCVMSSQQKQYCPAQNMPQFIGQAIHSVDCLRLAGSILCSEITAAEAAVHRSNSSPLSYESSAAATGNCL